MGRCWLKVPNILPGREFDEILIQQSLLFILSIPEFQTLYIPTENFKMWSFTENSPPVAEECCGKKCDPDDCQYAEMTVNEIINGKVGNLV